MNSKDQVDEIVQVWLDFGDALEAALDALVEVWEAFKQAIIVIVKEFLNLPAMWRLAFYVRLRHRCQWIPEQWAAFVAWRCPLWLVKCL